MTSVIADYQLEIGMNHERMLYRTKKDWILRFKLNHTLIGKDVRFFTNFPRNESKIFSRSVYQELYMNQPSISGSKTDRFDDYFELGPIKFSGAFHFVFTTGGLDYRPELLETDEITLFGGQGYFVVDSRFALTSTDDSSRPPMYSQWDLEGIVLQTYLAKNLGYFKDWRQRLIVAKETGYNMIHFTPVQELGCSHSGYSLRDQLKVNPNFTAPGESAVDWPQIQELIKYMEENWSILSMCDLVLNHTAKDSPWIKEHPECGYNMVNSPYLVPAFLIDYIVWRTSQLCARGELASRNIPTEFSCSQDNVNSVRIYLAEKFNDLKLHEFYQADIAAVAADFENWLSNDGKTSYFNSSDKELMLRIAGPKAGQRFGGTVDFVIAKEIFGNNSTPDEASANLMKRLEDLNTNVEDICMRNIWRAIDCVADGISYRFFDHSGPRIQKVTEETPLVPKYFFHPDNDIPTVEAAMALATSDKGSQILAYNGWVMNDDPMRNFAGIESDVYVRRELVVWDDSIKLRYGDGPEDCPYLWERTMQYATITAQTFHGLRLDNCHSTPLKLAQAVLDKCREIRPNIYVLAELFTGDAGLDNVFINKLGINSLIREALSAYDSHNEGEMVHRFGGLQPAGAFPHSVLKRRLIPSLPNAMFCDQTHDNESPATKRTVFDFVPSAGLVAISACGSASVRGYDEFIPYQIDVAKEGRLYSTWEKEICSDSGLISTKAALNKLHKWLVSHRYSETFVDQVDKNVVAVTRFCPDTAESIVLVAHSSFHEQNNHPGHHNFRNIVLNGRIRRLLIEARTVNEAYDYPLEGFRKDDSYLNGLQCVKVKLREDIPVEESSMFRVNTLNEGGGVDSLEFFDFPPGCVIAVSIALTESQAEALSRVRGALLNQFGRRLRNESRDRTLAPAAQEVSNSLLPTFPDTMEAGLVSRLVSDLTLTDINWLLYRCEREENCQRIGRKPYFINDHGEFVFCGFQGVMSVLKIVAEENDLGHPLCRHLREGLWLVEYLLSRISEGDSSNPSKELSSLANALRALFEPVYKLPPYLVPAAVGMLIGCFYQQVIDEVTTRFGSWISMGSSIIRHLAISSVQLYGKAPNMRLPEVLPGQPFPGKSGNDKELPLCSLAAGLPHFAEGMWRNWGRDTFIALPGCLVLTGRFQEAANTILQFASLLRHGLIPNLAGDGNVVAPRYNNKDSVWFWLYSITVFEDELCKQHDRKPFSASSGPTLMNRSVWRWFPNDDSEGWPKEADNVEAQADASRIQPLCDVVQEALQRHAGGISFRERNAGTILDNTMQSEGFDVEISVQEQTGFPIGGSKYNCGTWMDKMGSSERAGNKGIPATPRDGAAVEVVGLAYAVVSWLSKAYESDSSHAYYPHPGVKLASGTSLSWSDWAKKIRDNFENKFYIPVGANSNEPPNQTCYKDLVDSCNPAKDFQLRPNFLIAMTVAPDLFTPKKAWDALEIAGKQLVGKLGMRTLAPSDPDYRGFYNNNDDSGDFSTAHGFNYHQGPEWVWLTGFYIRSRLKFAHILGASDSSKALLLQASNESQAIFSRLNEHMRNSPWQSLPELTNANGEYCHDSCQAQAWSIGTTIEAIRDLVNADLPELDPSRRVHGGDSTMVGSSGSATQGQHPAQQDGFVGARHATIQVSIWNDQVKVMCNVS